MGEGEDDEREFTALGERDREIHFVRDALQPHREGQDEKHPGLHNQEDRKSEDHFHRLRHDEMHVDTHADGHEEETEKELLKGRNLGFQLVPETRGCREADRRQSRPWRTRALRPHDQAEPTVRSSAKAVSISRAPLRIVNRRKGTVRNRPTPTMKIRAIAARINVSTAPGVCPRRLNPNSPS